MMAPKMLCAAALFLASAMASPCKPSTTGTATAPGATSTANSTIAVGKPFGLMAIRSGSKIQYSAFQAVLGGLVLGLSSQDAKCEDGKENAGAVFQLNEEGVMSLYTNSPAQTFYVDRSGMGQGNVGYTNGTLGAPKNSESEGWELDSSNDLTFGGSTFMACPGSTGAWSLWIYSGDSSPAGLDGCVDIAARAVEVDDAVKCTYSE